MKTWAKVGIAALIGAMAVRLLRWGGSTSGRVVEIAKGTSTKPIVQGKPSNPEVARLMREYGEYLEAQGVNTDWFSPEELTYLRRWGVHAIPPKHQWDEMARTILAVAQPLRAKYGPIKINNGYRPRSYNDQDQLAASNSRHIWNQALDIQFPSASAAQRREIGLELARLWKSPQGEALKLGLGIYSAPTPVTIHVDTGYRRRRWKKTQYYLDRV